MDANDYEREIVAILEPLGDRRHGAAVALDRRSRLTYLGVRAPVVRTATFAGFSFYDRPADEVLAIWDSIWRQSPYGEVLFAAIEYYVACCRKRVDPQLWPVVSGWTARVENWAHADAVAGLYSRILEAHYEDVFPDIVAWNNADDEWLRRISLVSLIHYTGKNAVFLPLESVLPLVTNCLTDHRYYVQTAVGWVLREMGNAYPADVRTYLEERASELPSVAFSRAIERRSPAERQALRTLKTQNSKH